MAIFVENTMEAAKYDEARHQQARHEEYLLGAQRLNDLILEFCQKMPGSRNKTAVLEIEEHVFHKVVSEPRVIEMLDDLDINMPNKKDLFEVLDADQSGHIDLKELVQGLMKLRGYASKTDAVATLLTLRSLQRSAKVSDIYLMRQLNALRASISAISDVVCTTGDPSKYAFKDIIAYNNGGPSKNASRDPSTDASNNRIPYNNEEPSKAASNEAVCSIEASSNGPSIDKHIQL